jgi:hypothetical protein
MESSKSKVKLSCSVRIKPRGDDESGIQNFDSNFIHLDGLSLGPFSSIVGPQDTQEQTFVNVMHPLIKSFGQGINATVFVYGQTGSGKTHSLFGPPKFFNSSADNWGLCPKTIEKILREKASDTQVMISVVEIYFDDCFDLLNGKAQVPISGFGASKKAKPGGYLLEGSKAKYGNDGKWVSPY